MPPIFNMPQATEKLNAHKDVSNTNYLLHQINVRENRWGNHEWTIQRHWQQMVALKK